MKEIDLWGNEIPEDVILRDKFIEPPFSVIDTKNGNWQDRKRAWKAKGIKSEIGREEELTYKGNVADFDYYRVKEGKRETSDTQSTSIFDPALCELMYEWFCPQGGSILDPFAGGSVRGVVAHYLGYSYTGIELRPEQVEANSENAEEILEGNNQPTWYCGDSDKVLENISEEYDFIFSCPPYMDLEVYSQLEFDISNMEDEDFVEKYNSIVEKSCRRLKRGGFACFVVGEVRDKNTGFYKDFIGITKRAFYKAGMGLYNDAVLLNVVGSASMKANRQFSAGKKLVKIHQNILIFREGGK